MRESKYQIDKNKLKACIDQEMKCYPVIFSEYQNKPRKEWSDETKRAYKNSYSNAYNRLRDEYKNKRNRFWNQMTAGNMNLILEQWGLWTSNSGKVVVKNNGYDMIKKILLEYVIPEIEKTFDIKGIRINERHLSAMSYSGLLDLSQVEMNHPENVDKDEECLSRE